MRCALQLSLTATLLAFAWRCDAQLPIPPGGYDGFLFKGSRSSEVQLELFFDLMCPYCKLAWPNLKQVMNNYTDAQLAVVMHTFPLPYHHNAFYTAQGAHYLAQNSTRGRIDTVVMEYTELVFKYQEEFNDAETEKLSPADVKQTLGSLVQDNMGIASGPFVSGIQSGGEADGSTRTSWKFACGARAVSGTPSFMVNGVTVEAETSWTLDQWKSLIDPLLSGPTTSASSPSKSTQHARVSCPPDTTECEYLPGKIDCCSGGDYCIPNVGCRC